jgi:hypothetical protein
MRQIGFLVLFLLGMTFKVHGQSIYHTSQKSSIAPAASVSIVENGAPAYSAGLIFSLKSSVDVGITYLWADDAEDSYLDAEGYSAYINFLPLAESRGDAVGIELAFLYSKYIYHKSYDLNSIKSFGAGISISKKIKGEKSRQLVPQAGFTYIPLFIGDNYYSSSNALGKKSMLVTAALGLIFPGKLFDFIAEPTVGYELQDQILSAGLTTYLQF